MLDGGCMRLRVELAEAEKAVLESRLAAEELDRAALGARLAEAAMATEAASSKVGSKASKGEGPPPRPLGSGAMLCSPLCGWCRT